MKRDAKQHGGFCKVLPRLFGAPYAYRSAIGYEMKKIEENYQRITSDDLIQTAEAGGGCGCRFWGFSGGHSGLHPPGRCRSPWRPALSVMGILLQRLIGGA